MSIEEWAAMPEDEPGELVDGCLVEEEVADYAHETVLSFVNALVRGWVVPAGGFVAGSEAKFAIRPEHGRKPDLSVFLPAGHIPPRHGPIRVPPDIALEVVSSMPLDARRDRIDKVRDYAAFGVRWYWILDLELRTLEILELGDDGRYRHAVAVAEGSVGLLGCGPLKLDLDALWAEVDRLGAGSSLGPTAGPTTPPSQLAASGGSAMPVEETAIRVATLVATVLNVSALLEDAPALAARDLVELRSTLLGIVEEMIWLESLIASGSTKGIPWPSGANERIERLRTTATAWTPIGAPPADVRDAARDCLRILQPTA
jgi:Uma2 family endonuclease